MQADTTSPRADLWFGLLAGPTAWTLHELLSYATLKVACGANTALLLDALTVAALALAACGEYVAYHAWRTGRARRRAGDSLRSDAALPDTPTGRFLAATGAVASATFAFAILMEGIPSLVVSPCL